MTAVDAPTSAAPPDEPSDLVVRLLSELERMPAARGVALRVVQVLDDPSTGAAEAAAVLSADPTLTARVLRVANSVYYGLSGRVATLSFAITVVGFDTLRSLAVVGATGFGGQDDVPPGFWLRSAAVASSCSLVARRTGAASAEAFSTGLLHDLGSALLWRADRDAYGAMVQAALFGGPPLPLAETKAYGATAASLGADVLRAWHFPAELCDAIGRRHDLADRRGPALVRALHAGLVLADMAAPFPNPPGAAAKAALGAAGMKPEDCRPLVLQVREAAAQLASTFAE